MAFKNIEQNFGGYSMVKLTASGLTKCAQSSLPSFGTNDFDINTGDSIPFPAREQITYVQDEVVSIRVYYGQPPMILLYVNNTQLHYIGKSASDFSSGFYKIAIAVSDDSTSPYTVYLVMSPAGTVLDKYRFTQGYDDMVQYLTPVVTYQWQSVPSISGKNGILVAMSTISDMNDGEPVTTTDTTKFTLVEESNVGVITEDIDDSIKPGADAGGISGSGSNSGNQSTGYAFGQGESGTNKSGGGSGLYGGYKSNV